MNGPTLLLIGGSGFFGKSFLDAHARGRLAPWGITRITVLARHATSLQQFPELLGPGVTLVDADIATCRELPAADLVVHAAASTDARRYLEAGAAERANIQGASDNFCRLAAASHRNSRIVYTSSGAIYGAPPADAAPLAEDQVLFPIAGLDAHKRDYAEAKRAAEQAIAGLGARGLNVSIARCFAFVGVHLPRDQHFAIGNFVADGLAGRPVQVKARHAVYRSYLHADDLVHWLLTIAAHGSPASPVYNVGSPEAITVGDLARKVAAACGVEAQVPSLTSPIVDRYVPSVQKAGDELGLSLGYNLEAAIDDVVARIRAEPALRRHV